MKQYTLKIFTIATIFIVALTLGSLATPQGALASSFDLAVSPPIFQIELTPPAVVDVKEQIILENTGENSLDLRVVFQPFRPKNENGAIEYRNDGVGGSDPLIFQRIKLLRDGKRVETLSLPPKTKRTLDLSISIPKDEPPSDYYFTILFVSQNGIQKDKVLPSDGAEMGDNQPANESQGSRSISAGGVGINVLLSIGPKTKSKGTIEEFSTPFFQTQGPVPFTVRIHNSSSHFIYPKANIVIKNMFGQIIGKVETLPVNILSNSTRALPSKEQFAALQRLEDAKDQKTKEDKKTLQSLKMLQTFTTPVAIWPETFLLGPYTATLTVALSDQGPVYMRSIMFVGFPLHIIVGFAIAIGLVLVIRSRLKTKNYDKDNE